MHQRYLDERREKDVAIATMKEETDREIEKYKEEAEMHKERARHLQEEHQRVIAMLKEKEIERANAGVHDEIDKVEQRFAVILRDRDEKEK